MQHLNQVTARQEIKSESTAINMLVVQNLNTTLALMCVIAQQFGKWNTTAPISYVQGS